MEKQTKSKTTFFLLIGMSTAILLATPVVVLSGLGFFLDTYLRTSPTFLIVGGIMGFVGGTINVYKLLTKMKQR